MTSVMVPAGWLRVNKRVRDLLLGNDSHTMGQRADASIAAHRDASGAAAIALV
jgi:hypothetical protein